MKTFATIPLVSVLAVACSEGKKSGERAAPKTTAETSTDTEDASTNGGKSPDVTSEASRPGASGETEVDWSAPLRTVEVKSFHLLPLDKGKLSGYCIASSEKKVLPKEAENILRAGDGPCPDTVELDGEAVVIEYVCPAHETGADKKSQTILYAKIRTAKGYESIKKVGPAIIKGFCDRSNV